MITAERLADYLAGTLEPDESHLVEAELARDPKARAMLADLRRADAALAHIAPTPIPEGFEARLRDRLQPEITRAIAPSGHDATDATVLAFRSRRTRWITGVAAAAAAVTVIAGVGLTSTNLFGGADDMAADTAESEQADAPVASLALPESSTLSGPLVVELDRTATDAVIDDVLAVPELRDLAGQSLDRASGTQLAADHRQTLDVGAADGDASVLSDDAGGQSAREEAADSAAPGTAPCLDTLGDDPPPIIAYVEQATDSNGTPVVIFGLVTFGDGTYDTREVRVVEIESCDVIAQHVGRESADDRS
ncbi:MAG: hypothetical protein WD011_06610 [Nitriliruptoraceae bacterium]